MGNNGRFKRKHAVPKPGDKYGALTVIKIKYKETGGLDKILCFCGECGATSSPTLSNLRRGMSTRCTNCAKKASSRALKYIPELHRKDSRRLLNRIAAAVGRCTDPNHRQFSSYGGRGIGIFGPWLQERSEWLAYLTTLPDWDNPLATIDRIDNDRGYYPGNLRFVTHRKQQNNKRGTVWIDHEGLKLSATEFRERYAPRYRNSHTVSRKLREGLSPTEIIEQQSRCKGAYSVRSHKLRPKK